MSPSIGQLGIVLLIIILLFGAKKLPELAKGVGKSIKTFKKEMESDEVDDEPKVENKKEKIIETEIVNDKQEAK